MFSTSKGRPLLRRTVKDAVCTCSFCFHYTRVYFQLELLLPTNEIPILFKGRDKLQRFCGVTTCTKDNRIITTNYVTCLIFFPPNLKLYFPLKVEHSQYVSILVSVYYCLLFLLHFKQPLQITHFFPKNKEWLQDDRRKKYGFMNV